MFDLLSLEKNIKYIQFFLAGDPQAKQRSKITFKNMRVHAYTPKKTKEYEKRVKEAYLEEHGAGMLFDKNDAIKATIKAFYKIPESASKSKKELMLNNEILPIITPDCDNIQKSIFDGLNGTAYPDDKQIVEIKFNKFYSTNAGVVVTLIKAGVFYS